MPRSQKAVNLAGVGVPFLGFLASPAAGVAIVKAYMSPYRESRKAGATAT